MVLTGTQKEMVWMILEDQGNHLIQSRAKFVFFCVSFRAVHALSRETLKLQMRITSKLYIKMKQITAFSLCGDLETKYLQVQQTRNKGKKMYQQMNSVCWTHDCLNSDVNKAIEKGHFLSNQETWSGIRVM